MRCWRAAVATLVLAGATASPAVGQVAADTARRPVAEDTTVGPRVAPALPPATQDSLRAPLSPGRAFLNSFLLPGLGQSRLQRHSAGALYFTLEAVAVAMLAKSKYDLGVARRHETDAVVRGYQLDQATGAPVRGADGNFVPLDTLASRYVADRIKSRQTHVEDWIAILVFNHLFSGADAFVSSLLWDLPARVGFRPAPHGVGAGVFIRW